MNPMKPECAPETAEFVLPGHPDKLCDALADAIVSRVLAADPWGQCGIEAACVFDQVVVTGRIASQDAALLRELAEGGIERLAREAYASAGYGKDLSGFAWDPIPASLKVTRFVQIGPFEPGERELRHLADDQAICVGYANALAGTDHLPPAHWLARRIGWELHRLRALRGAGQVGPDGKVLVRIERAGTRWRPRHVSISLNHHPGADWLRLRRFAEEALEEACRGLALPELALNGAGMFVCGGPTGDNGLTGKKLVADGYGPTVPIGGGAWSGKDLSKIDRVGGLLARELALCALGESGAFESLVTLEYTPGCEMPVAVGVRLDARAVPLSELPRTRAIRRSTRMARERYLAAAPQLVRLSRWGHQQEGMPWEMPRATVAAPAGAREAGAPAEPVPAA
jgi:S-adenosylmethionine synthetase